LPKKVLVLRQQKFASIISLAGHIHNENLRVQPKKSQVASIFLVLLAKKSLCLGSLQMGELQQKGKSHMQ
jgi:hypothetical protein